MLGRFCTGARSRPSARRTRPGLEPLETRFLLSGNPPPGPHNLVAEAEPNDTLDQAQLLGQLTRPTEVVGAIGNSPAGAADVDWYAFTLAAPTDVTLSAKPRAGQMGPVLSLYNNDPGDFDMYDPLGHRQLAQAGGGPGTPAVLSEDLAAGTYYVAVSGAGNRYFHPLLADSGYPGALCNYQLWITPTDLGLSPTDGPVVLSASPGAGQAVASSPLVVRVDLSKSLDPTTVLAGQTVQLIYNPTGQFGNGQDQQVALNGVSYSDPIAELQLTPATALAPGFYEVLLAGNQAGGGPVLADPTGTPLGESLAHPQGEDLTTTFQVTGIDGNLGAQAASDDIPATAHQLGNISGGQLVQRTGAIGDDPAYNPASSNPQLANPAAQMDLYHFQLTGSGHYALTAEVFAGRIGSPLTPGLSLFQVDPATGQLVLVGVNAATLNTATATDGSQPLFNDPALYAGLTAGDYYLAVSGAGNVPDPAQGLDPGTNGIFDPNVPYSGLNGFSTGDYVLNVAAVPEANPPRVTAVSITSGATLSAPPTTFTLQFSEPINLWQLAYQTFQASSTRELQAVYVQAPDPQHPGQIVQYHPRLLSYDLATNQATFLMLDAVPNGPAALHLSGAGPLGLADLAGNPLVGNSGPGGDYVVPFSVKGPPRGTNGNPLLWTSQEPNDTPASAQPLGMLFADELSAGIVVQRVANPASHDTADYFAIQLSQSRDYFMSLTGKGLPKGVQLTLRDASGNIVPGIPQGSGGQAFRFSLAAGAYVVGVTGWTAKQAAGVSYQLHLGLANSAENPPALTIGPAPAISLHLADAPPAPQPAGPTVSSSLPGADFPQGLLPPVVAGPAGLVPATKAGVPVLPPDDVAAGILLTRVVGPQGVRSEGTSAGGPDRLAENRQDLLLSPEATQFLLLTLVTTQWSATPGGAGDPAAAMPGQEAVAPTPAAVAPAAAAVLPEAAPPSEAGANAVGGMPSPSAFDSLFALDALPAPIPATFLGSGRLPEAFAAALPGGVAGWAGNPDLPRAPWLNVLATAAAAASLTLGGWCTVRLTRRRPGGAPGRVYRAEEDSTDLSDSLSFKTS